MYTPSPLIDLCLASLLLNSDQLSEQFINNSLPDDLLRRFRVVRNELLQLGHRHRGATSLPSFRAADLRFLANGELNVLATLMVYMRHFDVQRRFAICVIHSLEEVLDDHRI